MVSNAADRCCRRWALKYLHDKISVRVRWRRHHDQLGADVVEHLIGALVHGAHREALLREAPLLGIRLDDGDQLGLVDEARDGREVSSGTDATGTEKRGRSARSRSAVRCETPTASSKRSSARGSGA